MDADLAEGSRDHQCIPCVVDRDGIRHDLPRRSALAGLPERPALFRAACTTSCCACTWGAFGIAAVTGVLLFMVNAVTYHRNTAFWLKMATIVLAGINMFIFERVTAKSVASWDKGVLPPPAARLAGALSIVLWVAVIVFGRWIGFTKGYDFTIPEEVQFDFSLPTQ